MNSSDSSKITFSIMFNILIFSFLLILFIYYGTYFFPITINYLRSLNYEFLKILNVYQGYEEPVNPFPAYQEGFKLHKI